MKPFIAILFSAACFIVHVHANQMDSKGQDNTMQSEPMMGMMKQMMENVTEEEMVSAFNDQDKAIYQQLTPQQKALVLKAANQFSCRAHMQMMRQNMMKQDMMKQDSNHK